MTGRRGRRRRKLLDDLKERRGYSHLKEEALDHTMWRAGFGKGFGPVVRQTTERMDSELREETCFQCVISGFRRDEDRTAQIRNACKVSFIIFKF